MSETPDDDIQLALDRGARYPFDADDAWRNGSGAEPEPPMDWAQAAARGVIADLTDRRAIKWGFDDIDESTRAEIVETMAAIIRRAHANDEGKAPLNSETPQPPQGREP